MDRDAMIKRLDAIEARLVALENLLEAAREAARENRLEEAREN